MGVWRVTYLPESTEGKPRPVTVIVEDTESTSLSSVAARLSTGALGSEWTHGRSIQSIEALEFAGRYRGTVVLAVLVGTVVVAGIVLGGFLFPIAHSWSFTLASSGQCPNGCGNEVALQSYPNGSYVSGTWSAAEPAGLQILDARGIICPDGGIQSGPDSCSQSWVTSGSFEFTSVGGSVSFVAFSENPENLSVSGTWSAPAW